MSLCKIVDLRAAELTAAWTSESTKQRALEAGQMLIREQADKVVGCARERHSVCENRPAERARRRPIQGEVDFIPRCPQDESRTGRSVGEGTARRPELSRPDSSRGLAGKMRKPPFVEAVFEGRKDRFSGDADG